MSIFLHLVRRELRDARWFVRGGLAAVAVLIVAGYWYVNRIREGMAFDVDGDLVRLWIAAAAVLGGGAVAAEAFAGDATSRRVEGAALLPTGLGTVFAAKSAATLLATLLFGGWAAACAPIAASLLAPAETAVGATSALVDGAAIVVAAPYVVGAIVLFAVLLEHGLGSIVAGIAAAAGSIVGVAAFARWDDWGISTPMLRQGAPVAVLVCAVVLWACAALAFTRGPIHLARRVRRAAIGLGGALAVLVPAGWATAAALASRAELSPGDSAVRISQVLASPDGKHALFVVGNARVPRDCHMWSVRLDDGTIVPLPGRRRTFDRWTADGTVRLWEESGTGSALSRRFDVINLDTGRIVSSRSADQIESEAWTEEWARFQRTQTGYLVEWPERGIKQRIESAWHIAAAPLPGRFVVWLKGKREKVVDLATGVEREPKGRFFIGAEQWVDGGRLLRYRSGTHVRLLDVETGEDRELAAFEGEWGPFSTGPYAVLHRQRLQSEIVDLRDGRTVAGPWAKRSVSFVQGSDHVAIAFNGTEPTTLIDCVTGRESALEPNPNGYGYPTNSVHGLPDGNFLILRPAGGLDVIDVEGRVVRTVIGGYPYRVARGPRPK